MERDGHQFQVCFRQLLTLSLRTIRLREQLKQGADETIYARGMVNIQASQNASQQVQWHKETTANKRSATHEHISRPNEEGHPTFHKSKETTTECIYDDFLNRGKIRDHIKASKGELDELIRLMKSGNAVSARKNYCHKCGVDSEECPFNGIKV